MVLSQSFLSIHINNGIDDVIDINLKFTVLKCKLQMVFSLIEIKEYFQRKTHRIIFLVTWYTSEWWFLRFTSKWSIIKQKNRVLSRIFWAGTDFEKSKKKWNHQAPVVLESSKKNFKETDTIPLEHIKTIFHFEYLPIWTNISDSFSCGFIRI